MAAVCCGLLACAAVVGGASALHRVSRGRAGVGASASVRRWRAILATASSEGRVAPGRSRRLLWTGGSLAAMLFGFSLLGAAGAALGAVLGPYAMRFGLNARRNRYAAQVDSCTAEFALALASALAGGNSVRGALLVAAPATPDPLSRELDRICVDLTLGRDVEDSLATLRSRTGSSRVDALAGAIELHRESGGDLVRLMRELAAAFRARDIARRDARAATAQARFTAVVVATIPLTLAVVAELARPGAVSGVFEFAPTALMMVFAIVLLAAGCVLCARIGRVR
jgi:tight adherence protein B